MVGGGRTKRTIDCWLVVSNGLRADPPNQTKTKTRSKKNGETNWSIPNHFKNTKKIKMKNSYFVVFVEMAMTDDSDTVFKTHKMINHRISFDL